jgi:hypothetical protein
VGKVVSMREREERRGSKKDVVGVDGKEKRQD